MAEKNPDEFYHAMMSQKGPATMGKNRTGTLNGDKGNKALSMEAVRLFKTQDLGYVRTQRNKAKKEVEDLERRVVGITGRGRKVVFVDGEEEQMERLAEAESEGDESMDDDEDGVEEAPDAKRLRKMKEKAAMKLDNRLEIARERLKALTDAEEALDLQRAKMGKSPTVGGTNKFGVKFKVRERKR